MCEISFVQRTHWHLKWIIVALDVMLVPLESKEKYAMGVCTNLFKCTDKIICNH